MIFVVFIAFFAQIAAIPFIGSAGSGDLPSGNPPSGAQQTHDALVEQYDGLSLDQKSKSADGSNDVKVESDLKSGESRVVFNPPLPEVPDSGFSDLPSRDPYVIVKIDAKKNGFLFFPSSSELSFADPIVDPRVSGELKLEPLEDGPMDITGGKGFFKTGEFYKLKDTGEEIVIKWFNEERLPSGEDWMSSKWINLKTSVEADFHAQSIAHMLSKLYSWRVENSDKVFYVQPLLVESVKEDFVHFGLMERRFEPFHRNAPPGRQNSVKRFLRFETFLKSKVKVTHISDAQGWLVRGQDLFMTDAFIELPNRGAGNYFENNLKALYNILKRRVVTMDFDSAIKEYVFGKSSEDDAREISAMREAAMMSCLTIEKEE